MIEHQYSKRNIGRAVLVWGVSAVLTFIVLFVMYRLFFYEPYVSRGFGGSGRHLSQYERIMKEMYIDQEKNRVFIMSLLSFFFGLVSMALAEHYTDWIAPVATFEMTLLRKEPNLIYGRSTVTARYDFWFINDYGEEVYFIGNDRAFLSIIEGNRVRLHTKLKGIMDFEILSIE